MSTHVFLTETEVDAIVTIVWVSVAILIGVGIHRALYWFFRRWAERSQNVFAVSVVRQTSRPAAYIFPLLAILVAISNITIPARWSATVVHTTGLLTIGMIVWSIVATIRMYGDIIVARHRLDVEDNLLARQLGTRVDILGRVAITLVLLVGLGMALMTFPEIRTIGTTVLASAGVIGIIGGLAARPLFENLVAGVQLALTQPIRIDDVVIVEKQYGRIEEIHSTYVVVRVWDLRRMVVPLSYFITTPFENWTRRTANLMGEVYVLADWTLDVEALRAQIPSIVARSPLWDKQFQNLQVTDVTDHGIQIRALVTARNSSDLWDLRCFVREGIVTYIREQQPHAYPRVRIELPDGAEPAASERIARALAETRLGAADHEPATKR